eukprot:1160450-Pelagomonas_calceolata.AAC.6
MHMRRQVNNMWRAMMKASFEAPAAIPIARDPERLDHLVKCNRLLEEVQDTWSKPQAPVKCNKLD